MGRKWIRLILTGMLALVLFTGCTGSGLTEKLQLIRMLRHIAEERNAAFTLSANISGEAVSGNLYWNEIGDDRWYCLELEGLQIYLHDDVLYFDKGRGYDLDDYLGELPADPEDMLWCLIFADLTQEGDVFHLTFSEEMVQRAGKFVPEILLWKSTVLESGLSVWLSNNSIAELELQLPEDITVHLTREPQVPRIPTERIMTMMAATPLPGDLLDPLIQGAMELSERQTLGADVTMVLECGPLPMEEQAELFYADGKIRFFRDGRSFILNLTVPDQTGQISWGLAVLLCRDGEIVPSELGTTRYELTVDPEQIADLIGQLLPESVDLDLRFEEANLELTASGNRWESLTMVCAGGMPFFITELPIGFTMVLELMDAPVQLPDGVA